MTETSDRVARMPDIRKLAWLHLENRKLLCVRRAGGARFYTPGGKPTAGENSRAALLRLIAAELGVALVATTIMPAESFSAPSDENDGVTIVIDTFVAGHEGIFCPSDDIIEIRYLGAADAGIASTLTQLILSQLETDHVID